MTLNKHTQDDLDTECKKQYVQLKSSDIPALREQILFEHQEGKCAICNETITEKTGISLDHQHKKQSDEIGKDGGGLIRGVLCRACNCLEGKLWNGTTRYRQPKNVQDRIDYLKSLIHYYESGTYNFIHPSEKQKVPPVSKRNYNLLVKEYKKSGRKRKMPGYPKSKKLTIGLRALFEEFNIQPYN